MRRPLVLAVMLAAAPPLRGDEIDMIEDFALARDRAVALQELVPGTEDYYYYHCLHYLNTEQFDQVEAMLATWVKLYQETERVRVIRNRLALLTYTLAPQKTLEHLQRELGLRFDHQPVVPDETPRLPVRLDPSLIARETLTRGALERYEDLQGFEDRALERLVGTALSPTERRHLLTRLERPDVAGLVDVILEDLKDTTSQGFGSLEIHRLLLLAQLEECLQRQPQLLNNPSFVSAYLARLLPSEDIDWRHDVAAKTAYLECLWRFVERLEPAHNSLKAHVLFHRLVLDRSLGIHDRERFLTYLALPRQVPYVRADYLEQPEQRRHPVDLDADFKSIELPPIGNDQELVRGYLQHFFLTEATYDAFAPFVDETYLKQVFAETKLVNGLGDAERWAALLPPESFQALKERVDIVFDAANRTIFATGEPVSLDLHVKNVATLIVKIFEVNTGNVYRQTLKEVATDIDLDGLVPNQELTFNYEEPALRRVLRHFEFPSMTEPGVYVIDFIGGGKSSRALIRKGDLELLGRVSTAGQVFTVLDEKRRPVNDATLWVGGREYEPDAEGRILVPFTTQTGFRPVVISRGGFSVLKTVYDCSEHYQLRAGLHVDRESLITGATAKVLVRPYLTLAGEPVTLSVLEDVRLVLTSADHDGVTTTQEIAPFALFEDRESVHELRVPARLARLDVTLKARVKLLSEDRMLDLEASKSFAINEIDRTDKIEDLHLGESRGEVFIEPLGKNGEPRAQRPVQVSLKHRDFTDTVDVTLQTDERGRVELGSLQEIEWVRASDPSGTTHTWPMLQDAHTYGLWIHGMAGDVLEIPYMKRGGPAGAPAAPSRDELSLLEVRGQHWVRDCFDAITIANGCLELRGLAAGDYNLLIKETGESVGIELSEGSEQSGWALGAARYLELRGRQPLQIVAIEVNDGALVVRLRNASPFARVHVLADRFHPAHRPFENLVFGDISPSWLEVCQAESSYVEGRRIGDEYQYIIDRRYAKKFPGNMLERPSLLLNPWAVRATETGEQRAEEGESFASKRAGRGGAAAGYGGPGAPPAIPGDFANLDFLAEAATVLVNLRPDASGTVTIRRKDLGPHQQIHVVAVEPLGTAYRTISLAELPIPKRDLRLAQVLDAQTHYSQRKEISALRGGDSLVLEDFTAARLETYESLERIYSFYVSLTSNANLVEFGFITMWPGLDGERKLDLYSRHACHELDFFLLKKDTPFFDRVIRPYLRNKKEKTFLDEWLLGDDLTRYLEPWRYAQLNVVERILLAQRVLPEKPATAREIADLSDLVPPDSERFALLFETGLRGRSLEGGAGLGLERAKEALPGAPAETEGAPGAPPEPAAPEARAKAPAEKDARPAQDAKVEDALEEEVERYFDEDEAARKSVERLFRKADRTLEWAENNYYKLPIEEQNGTLVLANALWRDYASHDPARPFLSAHFIQATRNFTEMMFALAVLDVPFKPGEIGSTFDAKAMTLRAASPMLAFHEEVKPARVAAAEATVLVSENFYPHGERHRYEGNERLDNYVTGEFLTHAVYGCEVVVTNPTSSVQKLDVLVQIPAGAIPVMNGRPVRSVHLDLEAYRTQTIDYSFYFPKAGRFAHYPAQVSSGERHLAHAEPVILEVLEARRTIDRGSWDYVSQQGSLEELLDYLQTKNLLRIDLERMAHRLRDKAVFEKVLAALLRRHLYHETLWSYGVYHDDVARMREFLPHCTDFIARCGAAIDSPLLTIDPVVRKSYQHLEYKPLINARAHQLGTRRQILNDRFREQYQRLLDVLSCRRALDDGDLMSVVYYLLLQDRVEEALEFFGRVNPQRLETRLQYDYLAAYLDFYTAAAGGGNLDVARRMVAAYESYPVERWRQAFAAIKAQLVEIEGGAPEIVDAESREQIQTELAHAEPSFDVSVEGGKLRLDYQNLERARINYYLMDIELLFSRNPFVQELSGQFSFVRPNVSQELTLPEGGHLEIVLPESLQNRHFLVEVTGGGKTRSSTHYSSSLNVQVLQNYGQVRVSHRESGRPLAAVYVKAYALMEDGTVRFYKDGYTDLRGRFDYATLSTDELDHVSRFSLLILSDEHGAVVREVLPPKR
ncbi:MAG: hypothetical protein AB1486_28915 [Planctomycetota bacterium]